MGNRSSRGRGPDQLLSAVLTALASEYGLKNISIVLQSLDQGGDVPSGEYSLGALRGSRNRKSALSQLGGVELPEEQKMPIRELADRFDRRSFLPSIPDVREFIIMMGERPGPIRDRSAAFRLLLPLLTKLSSERLRELALSDRHRGPSQLAPLSDAIGSSASERRRLRESK